MASAEKRVKIAQILEDIYRRSRCMRDGVGNEWGDV
jgi:hypothetical protein